MGLCRKVRLMWRQSTSCLDDQWSNRYRSMVELELVGLLVGIKRLVSVPPDLRPEHLRYRSHSLAIFILTQLTAATLACRAVAVLHRSP